MSDQPRPLFLIKPGTISRPDIRRIEKQCLICVAECSDTEAARYSEPPILLGHLDEKARAALGLFRMIRSQTSPDFKRSDLIRWFVNQLMDFEAKPVPVQPVKGKP